MNKKQLIARVRRYMGPGATGSAASAAVEAVLASLLAESETAAVKVPELGIFERKASPARQGYDINSGKISAIPATSKLTFRPSEHLKRLAKRKDS